MRAPSVIGVACLSEARGSRREEAIVPSGSGLRDHDERCQALSCISPNHAGRKVLSNARACQPGGQPMTAASLRVPVHARRPRRTDDRHRPRRRARGGGGDGPARHRRRRHHHPRGDRRPRRRRHRRRRRHGHLHRGPSTTPGILLRRKVQRQGRSAQDAGGRSRSPTDVRSGGRVQRQGGSARGARSRRPRYSRDASSSARSRALFRRPDLRPAVEGLRNITVVFMTDSTVFP